MNARAKSLSDEAETYWQKRSAAVAAAVAQGVFLPGMTPEARQLERKAMALETQARAEMRRSGDMLPDLTDDDCCHCGDAMCKCTYKSEIQY